MPAPHKLSRKLHEALGDDAAEAMIDWMNRVDAQLAEVRHDLADFRQTVRADLAEARQEINIGLANVRQETNSGLASIRQEMNKGFADARQETSDVREEMRVGFARVETAAAQRHADFMKWTLGFWTVSLVTYVGAVVALANVLK